MTPSHLSTKPFQHPQVRALARAWMWSVPLLVFVPALGQSALSNWHERDEGRWRALDVPSSGKAGFTQLRPAETGLRFTNLVDSAASAANRVLENGSGVAIGDFDQDGLPDVFLCSLRGDNALFRNLGGWKFANVTTAVGLPLKTRAARGAVLADLNGDRWPDLLISTLDRGVLCFLNDVGGRFVDATERAGTEAPTGSTTLALADIDGNGTLDLYAANYRPDDIRDRARVDVQRVNGRVSVAPALQGRVELTAQGLREFGQPDVLYLNDGHARFTAVPWTSGRFLDENGQSLKAPPADWGLSATFRDLNEDGLPDLYVCNDYWTPDRIWLNQGQGQFRAISPLALRHTSENSMGVDVADVDRDGHPDIFVADMLSRDAALRKRQALAQTAMASSDHSRPQFMQNMLFRATSDGAFQEIARFAGLAASDWSWQPVFVDVDLDGYEDLIISAGHRRDVQDLDATARIQTLQHPWPKDTDPKALQDAFTREMMEHAQLYPSLYLPIVTFRNGGNLQFKETTAEWGTSTPGVHQGIAFGDLDADGDLDFVVNNLNSPAGIYRNDSPAPRITVRLLGAPPNTAAIGARVSLHGGPLPNQSQEIIAGGRYLSASDAMLTFAAGTNQSRLTLTVQWPTGGTSTVAVEPNRGYELAERDGRHEPRPPSAPSPAPTWFHDVSTRLGHIHVDGDFDDFARQPLLPKKLSQLGPGIAWFDLNGDGHDDLIVGAGVGGRLSIFYGNGRGDFSSNGTTAPATSRDLTGLVVLPTTNRSAIILAGSANYEDGLATGPSVRAFDPAASLPQDNFPGSSSSTGPLALADIDGDGDLDLFVGGRVVASRYPESAASALYRREGQRWRLDEARAGLFANIGLVSGALWSDLDADGFPELVLACEWGPIRVYKNDRGKLGDATAEWGLGDWTGLWNGVTTADLDGDGRLDIVASNWGLNSAYRASKERPLELYYGDLLQRGIIDILETEYDFKRQKVVPAQRLDFLIRGLPVLSARFATVRQFSEASVDEVLGDLRPRAAILRAATLASTAFLNRGGHFSPVQLPAEAQFAPAFAVTAMDFDGDGREDVFLSQNALGLPATAPPQNAGRGLLLRGKGNGEFEAARGQTSGIIIHGEQRGAAAADFDEDGRVDLAVTQNRAPTVLLRNVGGRPGLRVRLLGTPDNPTGIGAVLRLQFRDHTGPAREIHGGSGYWSQDSAVQVLATAQPPAALVVRWPGGAVTTNAIPDSAREIQVSFTGAVRTLK